MSPTDLHSATMTDKADRSAMTPEMRATRRTLAHALWALDAGVDQVASAEPTDFTAQRAAYMTKAGRLLRLLKRKGLAVTRSAAAGADQD